MSFTFILITEQEWVALKSTHWAKFGTKRPLPPPAQTYIYEVYRPNKDGYSEATTVTFNEEVDSDTAIAKAEMQGGWRECDWDDCNHNTDDYRVEVTDNSRLWLVIRS